MLIQPPGKSSPLIRRRHQYRVDIKETWADAWQTMHYLEVKSVTLAVAPTIPSARCLWRAGRIRREDGGSKIADVRVIEAAGYFMRVVLLADRAGAGDHELFVGRFGSDDRQLGGSDAGPNADQELTVYGLAHELDRRIISTTVCDCGAIDADIAFNDRYERGLTEVGNRSVEGQSPEGVEDREAFVFAGHGEFPNEPALVWTARDAVEHLLLFHAPAGMRITLGGQVEALEAIDLQRVAVYGDSLWAALNRIIDRRQGLGFHLVVGDTPPAADDEEGGGEEGPAKVELRVFTLTDEPVTVGDQTLPANGRVVEIDLADDLPGLVDRPSFDEDYTGRYGRIEVVGERILSCGTFSVSDETLVKAWSDELESEYRTAVGADAAKNDQFRGDDRFEDVFTAFRVPLESFNWHSLGGTGGEAANLNPRLTDAAELEQGAQNTIRTWGLTACRYLPIRKERDESAPEPEYRDLLALLKDEETGRWVNADALSGIGTIRSLDNDLGVRVSVSDRRNHLLAKNHFVRPPASDANAAATLIAPKLDYTSLIVTMAVRLDKRLKVVVDIPGGDPDRVLRIPVRDAELHYVAKGTVVGVKSDGTLDRYAGEMFPRDDRDRLRQAAAQAKAWYGKRRTAATFTGLAMWLGHPLGTYITKVVRPSGHTFVNGVVSQIRYDLGATQSTTIKTSYGELDFVAPGKTKHVVR